jgi:hypothetical protein
MAHFGPFNPAEIGRDFSGSGTIVAESQSPADASATHMPQSDAPQTVEKGCVYWAFSPN